MKIRLTVGLTALALAVALTCSARTIHRSFVSRDVGFGGGAGASVPVDSRVSAALDEARQKEAEKVKVVIGRCTRVLDARTLTVVTDGNVKFTVRLERDATAAAALSKLLRGRKVRVEWVKKDASGRLLGTVFLNGQDVRGEIGEKAK